MRGIERTSRFKRDFKRELQGRHRATLEGDLAAVRRALAADVSLARTYRDHPLLGEWAGFRDCHVKPDLVLITEKPDAETFRLGSHSELGWSVAGGRCAALLRRRKARRAEWLA